VTPSSAVRDLGVYIDSGLRMQSHVRQTVSRCFDVLRQLRTVRRQVPTSVVLSRLDYCNRVLFGLSANLIQRLQSVQNAAARLIFRIRRSEHITPALISLHWPRVLQTGSYNVSIHPRHISVLPSRVSSVFPTWHPNNGCGLVSHIVWTFRPFVSLRPFQAPPKDSSFYDAIVSLPPSASVSKDIIGAI